MANTTRFAPQTTTRMWPETHFRARPRRTYHLRFVSYTTRHLNFIENYIVVYSRISLPTNRYEVRHTYKIIYILYIHIAIAAPLRCAWAPCGHPYINIYIYYRLCYVICVWMGSVRIYIRRASAGSYTSFYFAPPCGCYAALRVQANNVLTLRFGLAEFPNHPSIHI